jgi:hypothetical protein
MKVRIVMILEMAMLFSKKKVQPLLTYGLIEAQRDQNNARAEIRRQQTLAQEAMEKEQTIAKIADLLLQIENIHPTETKESITPRNASKIFGIMDKFAKLDPAKVDAAFQNERGSSLAAAIISLGGRNLDKSEVTGGNRAFLAYTILKANLAESAQMVQEGSRSVHGDLSFRSEALSKVLRAAVQEQAFDSNPRISHRPLRHS